MTNHKNVIVIGVGALGSHLIQFLRNLPVQITVVDFDSVETKNIQSQFHAKNSIGKSKVQAISQLLGYLWGYRIHLIPHRLTLNNIDMLFETTDLVIDCVDNGETRRIIQNYVREYSIPCLHGALAANGEFARVCWDEQFTIDDAASNNAATCENGRFLPFIVMASAYLAQAVQRFVELDQKIGYLISPDHIVKI